MDAAKAFALKLTTTELMDTNIPSMILSAKPYFPPELQAIQKETKITFHNQWTHWCESYAQSNRMLLKLSAPIHHLPEEQQQANLSYDIRLITYNKGLICHMT